MKYLKKYTIKEWKRFCDTWTGDRVDGQELTAAEVLLDRYKIILTDHKSRHDGKFVKTPLREKLKQGIRNLPNTINQKNFDRGMKEFDKGMKDFSKNMDELSKGLGGSKDQKTQMEKLWGKKINKPVLKVWSDKPVQKKKRKTRKKSKSAKWDQDEKNLEKLWGKKK